MGDYLDTEVFDAIIREDSVTLGLSKEGMPGLIGFQIPLRINLKKGDKISFYRGHITEDYIRHEDYINAQITRKNETDPFIILDSGDMQLLTFIKEKYEQKLCDSKSGSGKLESLTHTS